MVAPFRAWPYAALAVVQFEWVPNVITVWVTFRHPMDQSVTPPLAKWIINIDAVDKLPTASAWIDAYTLSMSRPYLAGHPASVTLAYEGPDENLRTTWGKQWEPFGPTVVTDVPYDFEHVLDIDIPNARVTINGVLVLSTLSVPAGVKQELDISGVNVILFDCSAGNIDMRTFSGGLNGQVLHLAKTTASVNSVTLRHFFPAVGQKIYLHAMGPEILAGEYGGWTLVCNGSFWFDVSHAKHV